MKIVVKMTRDVLTPDLRAKMATLKSPRKALESIGVAIVSMAQRAFTQASLRPVTWPALRPATLKAKKRKGYGSKPLISSGALAHSPRVVSVTGSRVVVGSDRKAGSHSLAAIHQLGSSDGRIPARPVWPFTESGLMTERGRRVVLAAAKKSLSLERR